MLQDFKAVAKAWVSPSMNLNILNLLQLLAIHHGELGLTGVHIHTLNWKCFGVLEFLAAKICRNIPCSQVTDNFTHVHVRVLQSIATSIAFVSIIDICLSSTDVEQRKNISAYKVRNPSQCELVDVSTKQELGPAQKHYFLSVSLLTLEPSYVFLGSVLTFQTYLFGVWPRCVVLFLHATAGLSCNIFRV
ncbi:hypothetical protein B0H13DRAFT_1881094 [Mycena leptocephala]|nr:hypothetical protein B0H13DRAFT_1881094 [Mycena leptocephala]